jgi:hypothetical protein
MNPVRQISSGKLEAAAEHPFGQVRALRRRYRSRHRRRPAASLRGDAVLVMAVKLDGFLAVFPRNVTLRTTPPGATSYLSLTNNS